MRISEENKLLQIKHELMQLGEMCGNATVKVAALISNDRPSAEEAAKKISSEAAKIADIAHNLKEICREQQIKCRWENSAFSSAVIKITNEILHIAHNIDSAATLAPKLNKSDVAPVADTITDNAVICRELIGYCIDAFVNCDVIKADSAENIGYKLFENSSSALSCIIKSVKTENVDEESISNLITEINLFKFIGEKALCISAHALEYFEI